MTWRIVQAEWGRVNHLVTEHGWSLCGRHRKVWYAPQWDGNQCRVCSATKLVEL